MMNTLRNSIDGKILEKHFVIPDSRDPQVMHKGSVCLRVFNVTSGRKSFRSARAMYVGCSVLSVRSGSRMAPSSLLLLSISVVLGCRFR